MGKTQSTQYIHVHNACLHCIVVDILYVSVKLTDLGCFSRADHAPVGVMELPWSSQFAIPANGGVKTPEVGQSGGKGEPVEHLGDASPGLVGLALVTPVACSQ